MKTELLREFDNSAGYALDESGDSHTAGSLRIQVGAGSTAGAVRDSIGTFTIGAPITIPMPGLGRVPYYPEATGFESSSMKLVFGQLWPRSDGRIQ